MINYIHVCENGSQATMRTIVPIDDILCFGERAGNDPF